MSKMMRNYLIGLSIAIVIYAVVVSWLTIRDIIIPPDLIDTTILFILASATIFYAVRTSDIAEATKEQADASLKIAEETREQRIMASRPVIVQKAVPLLFIDEDTGTSDNFQIYNAGNGPAIELEILLLDKDKKLLTEQREAFLRAGDAIKDFYPAGLGEHVNSDCYLLCRYQSIQSIGTKPSWYQTWLPFKPIKSQSKDYIYVQSGELEFEEVFEKRSF